MASPTYDAIVIGGGVVGASAGYHLAKLGAKALVIDRRDPGRASDAGAGILAPEINRRDPEAWFEFAIPAVAYYPELVAHLAELLPEGESGDTGFARCGMLLVAATPDEIEPFEEAYGEIMARREQRNAPALEDLHRVSAQEARELFPALGHVHRALYYRHGARVDGRLLGDALTRAGAALGMAMREDAVKELIVSGDRVTGVRTATEEIAAGVVILAGGAWSAAFGAQLGWNIPVEPQRGQIAHLRVPGQATGDWPIVSAFHGHYLVTWPNGRVVAGASRESGSGFRPVTSVAGIREVLGQAVRVAPGLETAELIEVRVGLRPATLDGLPVVGPIPGVAGVLVATGHGPTGLQMGPFTGKVIAELTLDKPPSAGIDAFSITRFGQ